MWRRIARKDVRDSVRERQLYVAVGLFAVVGIVAGFLYGDSYRNAVGNASPDPGLRLLGVLVGAALFLVPIAAIMLAQGRIVDKRSRGELVVLLGMPYSRRDVLLGSLAGRIVIATAAVVALFGFAAGAAALMLAPIPLLGLVALAVTFAGFAAIFVAVGVAISAATRSTTRAAVGAVGFYLFFVFRLHGVVFGLALRGAYGSRNVPRTLEPVAAQLGPFAALRNVVAGVDPEIAGAFGYFGGVPPTRWTPLATPGAGALVLAFWATVPLYLAVQRFEGADL